MLESETVKASLMHAQRTIQSQRTQLHREKTEKLEMRRVLQELRDELEKLREEGNSPVTSRRNTTTRRPDPRDMRKPSNRLETTVQAVKKFTSMRTTGKTIRTTTTTTTAVAMAEPLLCRARLPLPVDA